MSTFYSLIKDTNGKEFGALESSCRITISMCGKGEDEFVSIEDLSPKQITKIAQQLLHIASYNADEEDMQKWLKENHYQLGINL